MEEKRMRSVIRRKVRWVHLLGGAILVWAALMNSARADVFRVEIQGAFNSNSGFSGITIPPPLPFALSFYVNDGASKCAPNCVTPVRLPPPGSGVIYSYSVLSISGFPTINVGQEVFPPEPMDTVPGGAILFNQMISNGASVLIATRLVNTVGDVGLIIGQDLLNVLDNGFVPPPQIINMENIIGTEVAYGTIAVRVIGFAGLPGSSQCHGQSVATLAKRYGGLAQAAIALNYKSVSALQADITLFCGS
jgi:hypothetical protein